MMLGKNETTQPTANCPLVFYIRGKVLALKNDRLGDHRPNPAVIKFIRHARSTFDRQKGPKWEILPVPTEVCYYIKLGVYYKQGGLPTSDVDNAMTTLQEAMMGSLIENDRQVAHLAVERVQFSFPEVYSQIFFWIKGKDDFFTELTQLNSFIKNDGVQ